MRLGIELIQKGEQEGSSFEPTPPQLPRSERSNRERAKVASWADFPKQQEPTTYKHHPTEQRTSSNIEGGGGGKNWINWPAFPTGWGLNMTVSMYIFIHNKDSTNTQRMF